LADRAVVKDFIAGFTVQVTPNTDSWITGLAIASGAGGQAGKVVQHIAERNIAREADVVCASGVTGQASRSA
jgi:hypothetical protein